MDKLNRDISIIYTRMDGSPDITFIEEKRAPVLPNDPTFLCPYTIPDFECIFRIMGCLAPLNTSMASWIFAFLNGCPEDAVMEILDPGAPSVFRNPQSHKECNYIVLTRMQFHRLVCTALYIHHYRKIRYSIDFRIALDFKEQRRFMIILLSGAPGCGKSTIASLIASRLSVDHIISTDSVRHAMRTIYTKEELPIIYYSTYECGDVVDPNKELSYEDRCLKGYNAQADVVGDHLIKVIISFVKSNTSLIVEGVHLSPDVTMRIVQAVPNVIPFLIYIKKEDFHKQRFAVRAKYMTTDPSENRYISNFAAIRLVQKSLSTGASAHLIPKIDNRNIDRSLETMHQTIFSYMKLLEGRPSAYDPESGRLTFLDSVWKRRKQKLESKAKTMKSIMSMEKAIDSPSDGDAQLHELLAALPRDGMRVRDDIGGSLVVYGAGGGMEMRRIDDRSDEEEERPVSPHGALHGTIHGGDGIPSEDEASETEDPAEITLTDFVETDSELPDDKRISTLMLWIEQSK